MFGGDRHRFVTLMVVLVMIAVACSGTPATSPQGSTAPTSAVSGAPASEEPASEEPASEEPASEEPASEEPASQEPASEPPAGGEAELRWYCCVGTGEAPEQVPVEEQVAADFSEADTTANLTLEVVTYDAARNALSTQIQGGNPPDVVGPAGVGGIEAFHGQWLDLQSLIDSTSYDLSQYDETAVNFYRSDEEGQIGIPFAVYPSMLWYNVDLFDEAGLEYPPHGYGEPYVMPDGTEVPWDYNAVREIAMLLTVDSAGNDASSPDFDASAIEQYGFEPQRDDLRQTGTFFGAGSLVGQDGTSATVPDAWRDGWHFFYDGMWTDNFILTGPIFAEDQWSAGVGGYPFFSGNVAMTTNFLWTTYGVGEDSGVEGSWDLAAVPSHNGTTTAALNADTFVIHEGTDDPEAAFAALTYLQGDASSTLLDVYGGMPARLADQDAFFAAQDERFTHGPDWQVAKDSLAYADVPNFETYMPAYSETLDLLGTYTTKWQSTPGLDLDAEITQLEADIQAIWDAQ